MVESDLISRTALMERLIKNHSDLFRDPSVRLIWDCILSATAVDAAPVVRCKSCYYCETLPYDPEGRKVCTLSVIWRMPTKEDDFCSFGERREDDAAD